MTEGLNARHMSTLNDRIQHPSEDCLGWALTQAAGLHRIHLNTKLAGAGIVRHIPRIQKEYGRAESACEKTGPLQRSCFL
jgi:hypothetical protein